MPPPPLERHGGLTIPYEEKPANDGLTKFISKAVGKSHPYPEQHPNAGSRTAYNCTKNYAK
jgi:hypothetical protein